MDTIMELIKSRDRGEKEFHQAVQEVIETVQPVLDRNPQFRQDAVGTGARQPRIQD
jgi:glutamate dehydrogenase (NADP+)